MVATSPRPIFSNQFTKKVRRMTDRKTQSVQRARGAMDNASDYESGDCRFESCQTRQNFSLRSTVGYLRLVSFFWQLRGSYDTRSNFTLKVSHFGKTIASRNLEVVETSPRAILSNQFIEKVTRMTDRKNATSYKGLWRNGRRV